MAKPTSESAGWWAYLYRAVDKRGLTVDFMLSEHRDISAAKQFFTRAIERHGAPERITLDGYPATHSAVIELKQSGMLRPQTKVWTSKYLNHIVAQDHRRVQKRIYLMLGFKKFDHAAIAISGVELAQKIRKGQFDITQLRSRVQVRMPQVWDAILAD